MKMTLKPNLTDLPMPPVPFLNKPAPDYREYAQRVVDWKRDFEKALLHPTIETMRHYSPKCGCRACKLIRLILGE